MKSGGEASGGRGGRGGRGRRTETPEKVGGIQEDGSRDRDAGAENLQKKDTWKAVFGGRDDPQWTMPEGVLGEMQAEVIFLSCAWNLLRPIPIAPAEFTFLNKHKCPPVDSWRGQLLAK